jgi:Holliday junction resolvase-like predicted endonuclease
MQYATPEQLEISLDKFLDNTAKRENTTLEQTETRLIGVKFAELIEKLHKSTGQQVVVLIDEYDKPMIDSLNKAKQVHQEIKETLHNFYQVIKGSDEHIKFVFMTGVSRFAGLSVFSALNNLNDITMDYKYTTICGYTQEELERDFKEYIESTAESMGKSKEELLRDIKYWYNGYSWDGKERVYNPFSTLKFFDSKKFQGYWFSTGTPTFLIEQIKKKDDLELFEEKQRVREEVLSAFAAEEVETTALLFQTGYLTIKEEEETKRGSVYTIDFPNYEVRNAFLTSLLTVYCKKSHKEFLEINDKIYEAIRGNSSNELEEGLSSLYANIPYDLHTKKESYYHSLFLLTMRLIGYEVEGEVHTDKGRIDVVIKEKERVVVVEMKYAKEKGSKLESKIEEAINQIRENKYYEKYTNTKDNVALLAIVFAENKDIKCRFESLTA